MARFRLSLLLIFLLTSLVSLAQKRRDIYRIHKGHIYFRNKNLGHSYHTHYIIHKNPSYITFRREESDPMFWFSPVYCKGHILAKPFRDTNYDPFFEKFEVIGEHHAIDRTQVFFRTIANDGHPHGPAEYIFRFVPIDGADQGSFTFYDRDQRYGHDNGKVFYKLSEVEGADLETFEVLSNEQSIDRTKLELSSGLKVMYPSAAGFARDRHHIYWQHLPVEGLTGEEVVALPGNRLWVDGKVYEIINAKRISLIEQ